jgi:hypothetical protein
VGSYDASFLTRFRPSKSLCFLRGFFFTL